MGDRDSKAKGGTPEIGVVTTAVSAGRVTTIMGKRAAADDAQEICRLLQILAPVIGNVGVCLLIKERLLLVIPPSEDAARLFPDILGHIQHAIGTSSQRETTDGARGADTRLIDVQLAGVELVAPRIDAPIRAACSFLPLRFAG